jgi:aspartate-semialdehyde dehydrogenase
MMKPTRPIDVGVLGATGMVGQRFVQLLGNHPWFNLTWVGASERSVGKCYGELPWRLATPRPPAAADLPVDRAVPDRAPRLVFSALDASVAGEIETTFAAAGHLVVSNARNHRMDPLVPLLIPEVNPDHLALVSEQRRARGWSGAIVTNPNCSTVVLAMVLAALRSFDPEQVLVTTLQAASGAGYPGVPSLDLLSNVIPFIDGEEQKIESETRKILGTLREGSVTPHPVRLSAQTTRVPVVDGHTEAISLRLARPATADALREALAGFTGRPQTYHLPSAPPHPIVYREEPNRPQPRLDADEGGGMTVTVGRLRPCPILGWKLIALGHNTIRGAAGAALLNAELLVAEGYLD